MQACILRGATAIGGSCIQLCLDDQTLVLDLGLPLNDEGAPKLPEGLDSAPAGVVISHHHADHMGLVSRLADTVPIYGPATAQAMHQAGAVFTSSEVPAQPWRPLAHLQPVTIGPFTVTPYSVDHSAYESYALLVETGGRRLLYSGDLRAHGRKPGMWRQLVDHPPVDVHALLLEGTTLSRPNAPPTTESDVEMAFAAQMAATPGMVLACYSGHHIDRLVTVYRACLRAGRLLVLDAYGAAIAAATGRPTIPQPGFDGVRVFLPRAHRRRVMAAKAFAAVERFAGYRIYPEELADRPSELVMTMRMSMTAELESANCLGGASAVWSMWDGYLEDGSGQRFTSWCEAHDIELSRLHSSGHATPSDLRTLARAIDAERVVPIHTAAPAGYAKLHERVEPHADGEWWLV